MWVAASRAGQEERRGGGRMPTKGLSPSRPSLPDSASPSALTRLGPGTPPHPTPGHLQVVAMGAVGGGGGGVSPTVPLDWPHLCLRAEAPVSAI